MILKKQQYKALKQIVSSFSRGTIYAQPGDILTFATQHGDVLIVSNAKGHRFSVKREDIEEI